MTMQHFVSLLRKAGTLNAGHVESFVHGLLLNLWIIAIHFHKQEFGRRLAIMFYTNGYLYRCIIVALSTSFVARCFHKFRRFSTFIQKVHTRF